MLELHVWGKSTKIGVIDPEGLACAWLLSIHLVPQNVRFTIVTSCNTNLSGSGRLPLLLEKKNGKLARLHGFGEISNYISKNYPAENTKYVPDDRLSSADQLVNIALMTYVNSTLQYINQYNAYINTQNYELYTRKLFTLYLPFPMMYNQPLRLHHEACDQVRSVGLGPSRTGMLGFGSSEVADTELVDNNETNIEDSEVALTTLHEKVIIAKLKNKASLAEAKNKLRCLNLLQTYVGHVEGLFRQLNPNSPVEFAYLFRSKKISSSELLLYAYCYCLTLPELPDQFVANFLLSKFPAFWKFASTIIEALNTGVSPDMFREAEGAEVPNLWNEVAYQLGMILYGDN